MGIMVLCPPFLYQIQDGYRAYIFLSIKLQTISYTAEKRAKPKRRRLRLNWAGGLKEFRDQYTSLELQKKSLDWWGD